jgi:hypothetical protein
LGRRSTASSESIATVATRATEEEELQDSEEEKPVGRQQSNRNGATEGSRKFDPVGISMIPEDNLEN